MNKQIHQHLLRIATTKNWNSILKEKTTYAPLQPLMVRRIIHCFTIQGYLTSEAIIKISNRKAIVSFHILSLKRNAATLDQLCHVMGYTIARYLSMPTQICVHWIKNPALTPQLVAQFLFNSLKKHYSKTPSMQAVNIISNAASKADYHNRIITHQEYISILNSVLSNIKSSASAQVAVKDLNPLWKSKSLGWSTPSNLLLTKKIMNKIHKRSPKTNPYLGLLALILNCLPCYQSLVNFVFNSSKLRLMQRKYRESKNIDMIMTGRINATNKRGLWKYQKGNLRKQFFNSNVLFGSSSMVNSLGKTNLKITMN